MALDFRLSLPDQAAEETDDPDALNEPSLAQVVWDKGEVPYARSDLFRRQWLTHGWVGRSRWMAWGEF